MQALDNSRHSQSASSTWQRASLRMCWEAICCRIPSPSPRNSERLSFCRTLDSADSGITNDISILFWRQRYAFRPNLIVNTLDRAQNLEHFFISLFYHACWKSMIVLHHKGLDKVEQSYLKNSFLSSFSFLYCFLWSFMLWWEANFRVRPKA